MVLLLTSTSPNEASSDQKIRIRDEIAATAKAGEPDHYLAALLAPAEVRTLLLAIAAFGAELARIPRRVTEPMMGEIRLQWWRDMIGQSTDSNEQTVPLVAEIQRVAAHGGGDLALARLVAMTEARAFDLYADPMADEAAFYGYLDKTSGALFGLSVAVMTADAPPGLAEHAGRAYGMTRLLVDLPRRISIQRNPFPRPWLDSAGLSSDGDGQPSPAALRALSERVIAEIARETAAARHLGCRLSRAERVPLLPLATIPPYLAAIRRGVAPGRHVEDISPFGRVLRIAWAHGVGL